MTDMQKSKYWFFGSKLNTALLLILIILMVVAIRIMLRNEALYFPSLSGDQTEQTNIAPQILGNKEDLVSFSIQPGAKAGGVVSYEGVIKGGYFFEGNIVINILDVNKIVLKKDHAIATTEWMTAGPVTFAGSIDLTGLPKGPAFFEIHNDNASGLPEHDKSVLVPIVIQ